MGSVVSGSARVPGSVAAYAEHRIEFSPAGSSSTPLDAKDMRALARTIIDTEPSEIRGLLKQDPDLLRGWVVQLKAQQLQATDSVEVLHDALDHIRLCTLSPLKFAAE